MWSTRERREIAAIENYMDESDDMKVEIEALELSMVQKTQKIVRGFT